MPFLLLANPRTRQTVWGTVAASASVEVGMWLERYPIVVPSLSRPRLPMVAAAYAPSWVEWSLVAGDIKLWLDGQIGSGVGAWTSQARPGKAPHGPLAVPDATPLAWPSVVEPQHSHTSPPAMPHTWEAPAARADHRWSPTTGAGSAYSVAAPCASWPYR